MRLAGSIRAVAVAACAFAAVGLAGPAQGAAHGKVCGSLHARVPYSRAPGGPLWRVYVRGNAPCRSAVRALGAVMHLHGANHSGGSEVNSYFTYEGWTCPYGQMGIQTCFLGPSSHPRASAFADRCSQAPCPVDRVPAV